MVRWIAIVGQLIALVVAQRVFELNLQYGLCYMAVGVSAAANLVAVFIYPENKRLTGQENFLMILFDLLQLCILLFLTGGLNNPFSILVVGPVTISASVLGVRATAILAIVAIVCVSMMVEFHLPLRTEQGFVYRVPDIFLFGTWFAITIAILFSSLYSRRVVSEMSSMSEALAATQMALAREQKLTDLGGVVAAAAHELGTPLATIKLTSAELMEELEDRPELYEDAALIREQANRCRDILQSMGRAGKDDLQVRRTPFSTLIEEAAEPHIYRGKVVHMIHGDTDHEDLPIPVVQRRPEIIHGLRNLIQNAVDFADANVWVESSWTENSLSVRILDDGRGYPAHLIGRIGEPFVRRRRNSQEKSQRPGYEGMGLGLFIAKTLLERTGAELNFANGSEPYQSDETEFARTGAVVLVNWPRTAIEGSGEAMGQNPRFTI